MQARGSCRLQAREAHRRRLDRIRCIPGKERPDVEAAGLSLTGEIGILVADPDRSTLWVCEVKDLSVAFSPSTMKTRASRFLKPGAYIDQLLRNACDVQTNPAGWA